MVGRTKNGVKQICRRGIRRAGSISKLARVLGVRRQTVGAWLRGVRPTESSLSKLDRYVSDEPGGA